MTPDRSAPDAAAALRASTLTIIQYVLRLELPQASWERVAEIIEAAIVAGAADDLDGLRKAAGELMLISPVRIKKGDGLPAASADQKIFERANFLIDALQPMQPESAEDRDGQGR